MLWKSVFSRIVTPLSCLPSRLQCSSISLYTIRYHWTIQWKMYRKCNEVELSQKPATRALPLIYLVIYEIYEKNFINIDQCAMIHEQGLHRSNVCRVEKQIKFDNIAFVQYANAMNLIFQLKNEREKGMKIQNKTILFV